MFEGGDHRKDASDVFRAGAPPGFLPAAAQERVKSSAARSLKKSHASGPAELVRAPADILAFAEALSGLFSDPLRAITKKRHLVLPAERKNLTPGLQDARLVVRGHDCDGTRTACAQVGFQPVQIDNARAPSRDEPVPAGKVVTSARQHARMLCRGDPDLRFVSERLRQVMHHGVVRLRRAGGPDDLERTATEESSQLFSRGIQRILGARSDAVRTRRIPNKLLGRIQPRLPGSGQQRSRRVVIEIHWEAPA